MSARGTRSVPPAGAGPRGSRSGARREAGAALLVVLWLLVIIGVLATRLASGTRYDAVTAFNERCRLEAHYAARAGLADAAVRLRERVTSHPSRPREVPGSEPGVLIRFRDRVGEVGYRVTAVDINSRLNVNLVGDEMLRSLFEAAGLGAEEAVELAQAIADWIDPDDLHRARGAEVEHYRRSGVEDGPRNGPIASLEELLRVRGVTPHRLFGSGGGDVPGTATSGLALFLTTRGSGRVNLNTAPAEVLSALPGFDAEVVAVVLDLRSRRPIMSLGELSMDGRLAGVRPFHEAGPRLASLLLTGTASDGALVSSIAFSPGCTVGAVVISELAVLPDRVVLGPSNDGWAARGSRPGKAP